MKSDEKKTLDMEFVSQLFEKYGEGPVDAAVSTRVQETISAIHPDACSPEVLKSIFRCLDLTTLNPEDNEKTARKFTNRLNGFSSRFPNIPPVAALCVYPSLVEETRKTLSDLRVKIAAVGAGFPSSQTYLAVKLAECELLISKGTDEIDVVISVGRFLAGDYLGVFNELVLIRDACQGVTLKVILETGLLKSARKIRLASLLAMEAGADFIKTSTGKVAVSATPEAVLTMSYAIRDFHSKSGRAAGIKPAGGIVTVEDALIYYYLVNNILGENWLTPSRFRLGASRLANNLLSRLSNQEILYF